MCHDWPTPPIWPVDLPLIRELLTDEEFDRPELARVSQERQPHAPHGP